jgi:serine/threonine protein kinase
MSRERTEVKFEANAIQFIPPEIAHAHKNDTELAATPSLDMWGVGRILYFLSTPNPFWPTYFEGSEIVDRLISGKYASAFECLDKRVFRVVTKLLKYDPAHRMRLFELKVSMVLDV